MKEFCIDIIKNVGCKIRNNGEWFILTKSDIYNLCKPNGIEEQNTFIENILKMM